MSFPHSDHCNGKTFFNPGRPRDHGFRDVLRWKFTSRAAPWPGRIQIQARKPPPPPTRGISVTWINHATFLLQTPEGNILTDPVYSERVSPFRWIGPRRVHAPGIAFADLPSIPTVLLSHDHYDHCDLPTLRHLASTLSPAVFSPLGHRRLLLATGLERIVELDWWQSHAWSGGGEVMLTPAVHWSRRRPGGTNRRLWGGFFLRIPAGRIYFAGDTAFDRDLFREIRRRCGRPDLALLPIGAYEPRWLMESMHMNPAEAVAAHRELGARFSVSGHWGTWQLTDEARDDPPRALAAARTAAGLTAEDFRVLEPGESVAAPGDPGQRAPG